jgi:hypothetical protein
LKTEKKENRKFYPKKKEKEILTKTYKPKTEILKLAMDQY